MNDVAYKAIVSMIKQVPHIPEELRSRSPDTGIEESCVEYISTVVVLMGSCHKIVDQKFNNFNGEQLG